MTKSNKTQTPQHPVNQPCGEAIAALRRGVASVEAFHWYFTQLENLFTTIQKINGDELSQVYQLADLGRFLSQDWANVVDCAGEGLQREVERLSKATAKAHDLSLCDRATHTQSFQHSIESGVAI